MKIKSPIAALKTYLHLAAVLGLLMIPRMGLATSISCGQTVANTTKTASQVDQYTYVGTAGQVVSLAFSWSCGNAGQVDVYYPGASAPSVTVSAGCGGNATNLTLPSSGTYTLFVHQSGYSGTGYYTMSVQSVTGGGCNSKPIACGQTVTNTTSYPTDMNAYDYIGTAGQVVSLAFSWSCGNAGQVDVYYPGASAPSVTVSAGCGGNATNLTLPSSGTYTLFVHQSGYSGTGYYTMSVQSVTGGGCNSKPIACGQTVTNTTSYPTDMNAYDYIGTAGQVVSLAFSWSCGNAGQVDVYYPGASAPSVTVSAGCGGNATNLTLPSSGTYTLFVHQSGYSGTGYYTMSVQSVTGGGCNSKPIACGQTVTNTTSYPTDMNSYEMVANAGEHILLSNSGFSGMVVDIYDPTGSNVVSMGASTSTNYILAIMGIYTVVVHSGSYSGTGSYGLSLTVFGGCASLPSVSVTPTNLVVAAGSSAAFTAAASGPTPLYYQWWFGTNLVTGATNTTYSIAQVQTNNVGGYAVIVSNPGGAVTSSPPAQLSIGSILSAIPNTNILETVLWQYTPTVSGSGYTFGLSNKPSGMTVNSSSGTISWTPTEAQGPSTNGPITYAVYQSGSTVAWTNFTVIVLESNLPPTFINFPGTQTVYATTTLNVPITATDPDIPANTLTYAIVSSPTGVVINASSGLLTWKPATNQVGTSTIYVSVTDYNPWAVNSQHLSVTNSFSVVVKGLTAPTFTQSPSNVVVNPGQGFAFVSSATGFPYPTYQWQFSTNGSTWQNLNGATGATYQQTTSGLTNIGYYRVIASNSQASNTNAAVRLTFLNLNMYAGLNIDGPLGAVYNIQSTPNLASNWVTLTNISLPSQPYVYIDYSSPTNSKQFYRANPQ